MSRKSDISWLSAPSRTKSARVDTAAPEAANGERWPVDRDRRDGRVDAAAVGQAQVGHRPGLVDAATAAHGQALDDPLHVLGVAEARMSDSSRRPKRSTYTWSWRLTRMSVTAGSAISRGERAHAQRLLEQLLADRRPRSSSLSGSSSASSTPSTNTSTERATTSSVRAQELVAAQVVEQALLQPLLDVLRYCETSWGTRRRSSTLGLPPWPSW